MEPTFITSVPLTTHHHRRCEKLTQSKKKNKQSRPRSTSNHVTSNTYMRSPTRLEKTTSALILAATMTLTTTFPSQYHPTLKLTPPSSIAAENIDIRPQLKVSGGSASTTSGRSSGTRTVVKTVTRGVTLENADFSNADFEGVSFQQSILRQADFTNSNLKSASFFDADLTGAIFTKADMTNVNLELANLRQANLSGANLTGAYISSTTKLNGANIDGSDWTDTLLRKDQQNYLCSIAKGTNEMTGIETKESLFCP